MLGRARVLLILALLPLASIVGKAQTAYTCFPTCDSTDARFMALSGTDYNAFAGESLLIGIGTSRTMAQLEIGIFDGESGGMWDFSAAPLEYTLYADSTGTGADAIQLQQWLGTDMPDNSWWTFRMNNSAAAKSKTGNYVYYLRIRTTDTSVKSTSSFKIRTNGTINIKSYQAFAIYSPLTKEADARVVYPLYPELTQTTYDGTWRLFIDVPNRSPYLLIYDGDMDHGSYDGLVMDSDDRDTPNNVLPVWATRSAVYEGNATSVWPIRDSLRPNADIMMSGDPADDNQNKFYRRAPALTYQLITPDNKSYVNSNPSGNLEWEQFRIDTEPMDDTKMDYHVDSVPAGIYEVRVSGMDLGNVNSWKFFNDASGSASNEVVGVDIQGLPVAPVRAMETVNASASGKIFYDNDLDRRQDGSEPGIPSVMVTLLHLNPDGSVISTEYVMTEDDGTYSFAGLGAGLYKVVVDTNTIEDDAVGTVDPDGLGTRNVASFSITTTGSDKVLSFGYKRTNPPGAKSLSYWVNNPDEWPCESVTVGSISYTKAQAIVLLKKPTSVDKTLAMANQLIVAKLNMAIGVSSACISTVVSNSEAWVRRYPPGSARKVTARQHRCGGYDPGFDWSTGSPLHSQLSLFNRGSGGCGCVH